MTCLDATDVIHTSLWRQCTTPLHDQFEFGASESAAAEKLTTITKERTDVKDFFLIDSSLIIPSATLSAVIRYSIATNEEVEIVSASSIRDIQLDVDFVAQWTETSSAEWTTAWNRLLLSSSRCFGSASSWRVAVSTEIFKTPSLPPLYYASERRGCRCRQ